MMRPTLFRQGRGTIFGLIGFLSLLHWNVNAGVYPCFPPMKADSFKFVMGNALFPVPELPLPAKGVLFSDPNFNTSIRRFTDPSDLYSGHGIENEYAKIDPENSNGSYVILRGNDGAWYLYNRAGALPVRRLDAFDACGQEPEPRWEPLNPMLFYYICNAQLRMYEINQDSSIILHDFKKEIPGTEHITTGTEGDASLNRRYWCFTATDAQFRVLGVLVYDKTKDLVIGPKTAGFPDDINWVSMDMSGKHCMIGYESINYLQVFSADMNTCINLPAGSNAHGDLARTRDGRDVFVYQNTATDFLAMADVETGVETPLLQIPFDVNPDIGLHVSGNCSATPGWAIVSTYGSEVPPAGSAHSWMDAQLFMVELAANPRIWRIAHTHAYTSLDFSGEKNYFAEAFATINTRGTRIYFGSNWGIYTPEYTDTYEVQLPDFWSEQLTVPVDNIPARDFSLRVEAFPNPFRDKTTIRIHRLNGKEQPAPSQAASRIALMVFDLFGRKIAELLPDAEESAVQQYVFDAAGLPAGTYFLQSISPSGILTQTIHHTK